MIRFASIAIVLLAACSHDGESCTVDGDCGDDVCARTNVCAPKSQVWSVHVTWTVNGVPPTAASCASLDPLEIGFYSQTESIAFAPVPCIAGLYSIDKLPIEMDEVTLGPQDASAPFVGIPSSGDATIDLP